MVHDPSHPEVRALRERYEEEHQALLEREEEKAALEKRVQQLTQFILTSTAAATNDAQHSRCG